MTCRLFVLATATVAMVACATPALALPETVAGTQDDPPVSRELTSYQLRSSVVPTGVLRKLGYTSLRYARFNEDPLELLDVFPSSSCNASLTENEPVFDKVDGEQAGGSLHTGLKRNIATFAGEGQSSARLPELIFMNEAVLPMPSAGDARQLFDFVSAEAAACRSMFATYATHVAGADQALVGRTFDHGTRGLIGFEVAFIRRGRFLVAVVIDPKLEVDSHNITSDYLSVRSRRLLLPAVRTATEQLVKSHLS